MLAMGRAFMSGVRFILLDEPSMGLAPFLMQELFRVLKELNEAGTTILVVEQNARIALKYAHRAYVLEAGKNRARGPAPRPGPQSGDSKGLSGLANTASECCGEWTPTRPLADSSLMNGPI